MKYLFTIIVSFAFVAMAAAQSRTETVAYQKINRQAVVNEIPFPEKTVRDAIENKMEQMGYKGKDVKGFTVYKGVRLADLGNDSYDLYFSADRKSRKEKGTNLRPPLWLRLTTTRQTLDQRPLFCCF